VTLHSDVFETRLACDRTSQNAHVGSHSFATPMNRLKKIGSKLSLRRKERGPPRVIPTSVFEEEEEEGDWQPYDPLAYDRAKRTYEKVEERYYASYSRNTIRREFELTSMQFSSSTTRSSISCESSTNTNSKLRVRRALRPTSRNVRSFRKDTRRSTSHIFRMDRERRDSNLRD
jgi:hypothetical protein